MPPTRFLDFVSPAGRNQIAKWYSKLSPMRQAVVDDVIAEMEVTEVWKLPQWLALGGKQHGLGEVRFVAEKVQHRLVGFRRDCAFTILIGCTHKGKAYDPASALETAVTRWKQLQSGEATTCEHDSEEENDLEEAGEE